MADLTKRDWTRAAFVAWGQGGLGRVAVEPLAATLGVTKGSFYWHFSSRSELIDEVVGMWEVEGTEAVIARLKEVPDPRERLKLLFSTALSEMELLRGEAAIAAAALSGDERARPAHARVTERRLGYVTALYTEMGFYRAEARRRAIATYSAYLGSTQLILMGARDLTTPAQLRRLVETLVQLFVPAGPSNSVGTPLAQGLPSEAVARSDQSVFESRK